MCLKTIGQQKQRNTTLFHVVELIHVFGKKWLLFGKNQDMTNLIKKEHLLCQLQRSKSDKLLHKTT